MSELSRLKKLQQMANEAELRKKVLEPLFERMGFGVVNTHGSQEYGKDFVLSIKDELLDITKLAAVIVKKGNIVVGSRGGGSHLLDDIGRQVKQAFEIGYPNPDTKRVEKISKAYVVTDGNISPNAKQLIAETWGNSKELYEKNTEFIQGARLVDISPESNINIKRACVDLIKYLYTGENKVKLIGCKEFKKMQKKVNVLFEKKRAVPYFEKKRK